MEEPYKATLFSRQIYIFQKDFLWKKDLKSSEFSSYSGVTFPDIFALTNEGLCGAKYFLASILS